MTLREWAIRCVAAYVDTYPDDPEVVRFKAAMAELREQLKGESDGDS